MSTASDSSVSISCTTSSSASSASSASSVSSSVALSEHKSKMNENEEKKCRDRIGKCLNNVSTCLSILSAQRSAVWGILAYSQSWLTTKTYKEMCEFLDQAERMIYPYQQLTFMDGLYCRTHQPLDTDLEFENFDEFVDKYSAKIDGEKNITKDERFQFRSRCNDELENQELPDNVVKDMKIHGIVVPPWKYFSGYLGGFGITPHKLYVLQKVYISMFPNSELSKCTLPAYTMSSKTEAYHLEKFYRYVS